MIAAAQTCRQWCNEHTASFLGRWATSRCARQRPSKSARRSARRQGRAGAGSGRNTTACPRRDGAGLPRPARRTPCDRAGASPPGAAHGLTGCLPSIACRLLGDRACAPLRFLPPERPCLVQVVAPILRPAAPPVQLPRFRGIPSSSRTPAVPVHLTRQPESTLGLGSRVTRERQEPESQMRDRGGSGRAGIAPLTAQRRPRTKPNDAPPPGHLLQTTEFMVFT